MMERGRLHSWNCDRGYGFVRREAGRRDGFLHVSEVVEEINVGDLLEFDIREDVKGPRVLAARRARGAAQ